MSLNPYTAVFISIVLLCIPKLQIDSFYAWLGIIMIFWGYFCNTPNCNYTTEN